MIKYDNQIFLPVVSSAVKNEQILLKHIRPTTSSSRASRFAHAFRVIRCCNAVQIQEDTIMCYCNQKSKTILLILCVHLRSRKAFFCKLRVFADCQYFSFYTVFHQSIPMWIATNLHVKRINNQTPSYLNYSAVWVIF